MTQTSCSTDANCEEPPPPPPPPPPDYIPQGLATAPGNLEPGQDVSFSATIRNQGNANLFVFSQTRLRLDVGNNGPPYDTTFGNMPTRPLAQNGTEVETWVNAWSAVAGTHRFEVCADITNILTESNEANNCATQTFTVDELPPLPPPPLPPPPLPPPPLPPPAAQCSDRIDNDGDGKIDYGTDPGCSSPSDNSEYSFFKIREIVPDFFKLNWLNLNTPNFLGARL